MQHQTLTPGARPPWRMASTLLALLLLLTVNVAAVSILEARGGVTPAISVARHVLQSRQTTINMTALYEQECGPNFVDCGNQSCCTAGQECLVGTQTGKLLCNPLSGSAPSPTPTLTPANTGSQPVPVAGIVGGVIGAVVVIASLCIAYLFYRRRHPIDGQPDPPSAPYPNFQHQIEAKYPPPSETASYSGENWQPGTYLYHNRNRAGSMSASVASTRGGCTSPTPYENLTPGGLNIQGLTKDGDPHKVIELPDSAVSPPMELPAEGYFEEKPQPPPPPPPEAYTKSTTSLSKPPSAFKNIWRKN